MMTAFAHKDDCKILRGNEAKEAFPERDNNMAKLIDQDGELLFQFPGDWTDRQIWHALCFVNAKYDSGINLGVYQARTIMKHALGLNPE